MKWKIALAVCCIFLLGVNLALIRQNRQLKAQIALPPGYEVTVGVVLPDLKGFDLEGKPVTLAYGHDPRKVLVLVYSPACHFCAENWPQWWQLMASMDRDAVRPVGVDVTSSTTAVFLSEHRFKDIPVLVQIDPADRIQYRLQVTPQTILIGSDGKVEKVWSGVLDNAALADLKSRVSAGKRISAASTGKSL